MPGKKGAQTDGFEVRLPQTEVTSNDLDAPAAVNMAALEMAAVTDFDPSNRTYSTILSDGSTAVTLTQDAIENYSVSPQSDKEKTVGIINIIRQYVNKNDIIGIVVEAIENNVNTKYRLHWRDARSRDVDKRANEEAKKIIAEFNEKISLPQLIRQSTANAYQDGTYIMCLRSLGKKPAGSALIGDYVVDTYPIGVAEVSQYTVGGDPYVTIDLNELKSRLRKTYTKTKKNKALFYENELKEVEATFPKEVADAYKTSERYAKLDIKYTGVIRVNRQGKQYGLSPIFRALSPTVMLETLDKADRMAAKSRTKKIIAQYLNKEILGSEYNKDTLKQQAYAHKSLLEAWKQPIVVVTAPATVREIAYVEPKAELTSIDTVNYYRTRVMSTLGISFLVDGNSKSISVANISIKQLMRSINKITMQMETIIHKWYQVVLQEAGIDPTLAPTIQVIDAEMMEADLKLDFADVLFNKFNLSRETVLDLLDLSLEDERAKREVENEDGLDEIFYPRATAYNNSGDVTGGGAGSDVDKKQGGRPAAKQSKDEDKQQNDKLRNDIK